MPFDLKYRFTWDLNLLSLKQFLYWGGGELIGTCTVNLKTALVFGGFGLRQPWLITLSREMGLELVSMPKFTQQIRRYYSIDTLIHKAILHIYDALCLCHMLHC